MQSPQVAAGVAEILRPIWHTEAILPATESVARELVPLKDEPERAGDLWSEFIATQPDPTASNTIYRFDAKASPILIDGMRRRQTAAAKP
jgi:hypothetical protein